MGGRKKMISIIVDIKTVLKGAYFIITSFIFIFAYQYFNMGRRQLLFHKLQTPLFIISLIGILIWIIPLYYDLVNKDSQELFFSFPTGGFLSTLIRPIRLYIIYTIFILNILFIVYMTTDLAGFKGHPRDALLIAASMFFVSGLGLVSMFIGRHLIIGFAVPVFIIFYSYFYRGSGLWIFHPCQWIYPNPMLNNYLAYIGQWIAGFVLYLLSGWLSQRREYLMKS